MRTSEGSKFLHLIVSMNQALQEEQDAQTEGQKVPKQWSK